MSYRFRISPVVCAVLLVPSIARAQSQTARVQSTRAELAGVLGCRANTAEAERRARDFIERGTARLKRAGGALALSQFVDPSLPSQAAAVASNIASLDVTREGKVVGKGQLAWRLETTTLSVTLQGPLGEGDSDALTESGLTNGAKVLGGISHTFWQHSSPVGQQARGAFTAAQDDCANLLSQVVQSDTDAMALILGYEEQALASGRLPRSARGISTTAPQDPLDALAREAVSGGAWTVSRAVTTGVSIGQSRDTFKFITEADLTPQTTVARGEEFAMGIAFAATHKYQEPGATTAYVFPSYNFSVEFKKSKAFSVKSRQICKPFGTEATQCQSLNVGAPAPEHTKEVAVDARRWAYGDRIATNLRFVRDFEGDANRVETRWSYLRMKKSGLEGDAPKYLIDTDALTIGARAGYQWGKVEGSYFAVFFAASFGAISF